VRDPLRARVPSLGRRIDCLELAFDSKRLRTICESEAAAKRELGPNAAEFLKHRLVDLRAATSTLELVAGQPHLLEDTSEHMVVDLADGYQMIFCANHPKNPLTETGTLDWTRVSRVKILSIDKNNG
jgi:hypothetical protein